MTEDNTATINITKSPEEHLDNVAANGNRHVGDGDGAKRNSIAGAISYKRQLLKKRLSRGRATSRRATDVAAAPGNEAKDTAAAPSVAQTLNDDVSASSDVRARPGLHGNDMPSSGIDQTV